MRGRSRQFRTLWLLLFLGFPGPSDGQAQRRSTVLPSQLFDSRLSELRRASVSWDTRRGPRREVVDVVCLVPDVPTFLEALATWDEGHYFPILIDDVHATSRFLRAFRPARVVRYPRRAGAIPAEQLWSEAVAAVGRAWVAGDAEAPPGDRPSTRFPDAPPALVFSAPGSPALAGAVALAAGRFQPLLRWESGKTFGDLPNLVGASVLLRDLQTRIAEVAPQHGRLGDACDFLTMACDYPYRLQGRDGPCAFDDFLGRSSPEGTGRWAFAGRLLGDPPLAVYRAMAALFLQPEAATFFNTYGEGEPWSDYAMGAGARRLSGLLPVGLVQGQSATLAGWHKTFDPINRAGLVLINTKGSPGQFDIAGGGGSAFDIPPSLPTAVAIIHSFSAADPNDPETIAGRWLDNGAFIYFGSTHEPFLMAFRTPTLVGNLIADGLPLAAALRQGPEEPLGKPWRLAYFGDPLYRVRSADDTPRRLAEWPPLAAWPAYAAPGPLGKDAPDEHRLAWSLRMAIVRSAQGAPPATAEDLVVLKAIRPERLAPALGPVYQALLSELLYAAGERQELIARFPKLPDDRKDRWLIGLVESARVVEFERAMTGRDFPRALAVWQAANRAEVSPALRARLTQRLGMLADESPAWLSQWRQRLRTAAAPGPGTSAPAPLEAITSELKRVEEKLGPRAR